MTAYFVFFTTVAVACVSTIVDQQGLAGGRVEGFVQRAPGQISPMADVYESGDGQGAQGRSRVTLVP